MRKAVMLPAMFAMKHPIRVAVLSACFSYAIAGHAAEWTLFLGEAGQARSMYYDKQSIKKLRDGLLEVTTLANGTRGSNISVYRIDCAGRRIQSMSMKTYSEKMGAGRLGLTSNTALSMKPLQEAAELDPYKARLFELACAAAR